MTSPTLLMIQTLKDFQDFECIGSSQGWIVLLNKESNDPFLFNPFSKTRIPLPNNQTLESFVQVQITKDFGSSKSTTNPPATIVKVVLCGNPSHDKNYVVIVMYSCWIYTKLAFYMHGDKEWKTLDGELETYYDVICHDATKTAFALGSGPRVEVHDFSENIVRRKTMMNIEESCPRKLQQAVTKYPSDLYTSQWYLALSSLGQIFLVVRYIGEFVRFDGEVVYEGDTLTDYASEPLVCPYKTVAFEVFKLIDDDGGDRKKWADVESLDDSAMFLGGNHSMMMSIKEKSRFKRNTIYFTDDYWDRMNEDYCYGGHDNGVYNMEDGSIETVVDSQEDRIVPPPSWIIS